MTEEKATVLLIDDDRELRSVLCRALARAGFNVVEADDGRLGLKLLVESQVDLLITDHVMPNVEGVELILKARQWRPDLPIIAMSGGGRLQPDDYLKIVRCGGLAKTLAKPFNLPVFLATVTGAIDEARVARNKRQAVTGNPDRTAAPDTE